MTDRLAIRGEDVVVCVVRLGVNHQRGWFDAFLAWTLIVEVDVSAQSIACCAISLKQLQAHIRQASTMLKNCTTA